MLQQEDRSKSGLEGSFVRDKPERFLSLCAGSGLKKCCLSHRGLILLLLEAAEHHLLSAQPFQLPSPHPRPSSDGCRISYEARSRLDARCNWCLQAHLCDRQQAELRFARPALAACHPEPAAAAPVLQTLIRRRRQAQEERLPCLPLGMESNLPLGHCWPCLHRLLHLREQNSWRPTRARPDQEDPRHSRYVSCRRATT